MKIKQNTVFYSALILTASGSLLQLLGFLYRILLSRAAGAQALALFQLANPVYSLIYACSLSGITLAVTRICAERKSTGVIRKAFLIFAVIFSALAAPVALASPFVARRILGDESTLATILILLPCLFLTGIENIFKSAFHGIDKVKFPVISEITEQIVRIIAVAALFFLLSPASPAFSSALIAAGMVISELVSVALLFVMYLFYKKSIAPTKESSPSYSQIAHIAFPVACSSLFTRAIGSLCTVLIPQRLMASGMTHTAAMDIFGTLTGMTVPLLWLPSAFIFPLTTVIMPKLAIGMQNGNSSYIRRKIGKTLHATSLLAFPALAFLAVMGGKLALLIYGVKSAGNYTLPLAIDAVFGFFQVVTASLLNGLGMQSRAAFSVSVSGIISLAFIWFGIGTLHLGINGYISGEIIGSMTAFLINITGIIGRTRLKIQWRNWLLNPLFGGILVFFCAKPFYLSFFTFLQNETAAVVFSAAVCTVLYVIFIRLCGVDYKKYFSSIFTD